MKQKVPFFFLLISLFFLFFVIFKSEFQWEGERREHYLKFYIFAFAFVVFSISSFFINEKLNTIFFISFCSFILSFYLFEYYTNFIKQNDQSVKKNEILLKLGKPEFDTRQRNKVYYDLKKYNKYITLAFYPEYFVYKKNIKFLPLSGKSNSETILCNESGNWITYESDKYGFRNLNEDWEKKYIDIFIVGDSFAQGFCVEDDFHIATQLKKITKKNVINVGYGSNGPLLEYASVIEYLPKNTKNLLWLYYEENDLENLNIELKNNILQKYLNDKTFSQNLKNKQKFIDNIIEQELKINLSIINNLIKFLKLSETRKIITKYIQNKKTNEIKENYQEFFKILLLTKELLEANGTKFYFVYLPEYGRYSEEYTNHSYKKIINFLKKNQINFIDINEEIFSKTKNPLKYFPFELHGHYNEEAYKLISTKINEKLNLR